MRSSPAAPADPVGLELLIAELPEADLRHATAHASWAKPRSASYERLAFVGDTVLDYIVTRHLDREFETADFTPGQLTRIRARVVSDDSLRLAAKRIGLDEAAVRMAPESFTDQAKMLVSRGKPLASMLEAIIAVCWRASGEEATAAAVIETLRPELDAAVAEPVDPKSLLQEELAKAGRTVRYDGGEPEGPPHAPTFSVTAWSEPDGERIGSGSGGTKKAAEAAAAAAALELLEER